MRQSFEPFHFFLPREGRPQDTLYFSIVDETEGTGAALRAPLLPHLRKVVDLFGKLLVGFCIDSPFLFLWDVHEAVLEELVAELSHLAVGQIGPELCCGMLLLIVGSAPEGPPLVGQFWLTANPFHKLFQSFPRPLPLLLHLLLYQSALLVLRHHPQVKPGPQSRIHLRLQLLQLLRSRPRLLHPSTPFRLLLLEPTQVALLMLAQSANIDQLLSLLREDGYQFRPLPLLQFLPYRLLLLQLSIQYPRGGGRLPGVSLGRQ